MKSKILESKKFIKSLNHRIFFRADADNKIGFGHLIRCVSLAEILSESFECILIIKNNKYTSSILEDKNFILIMDGCEEDEISQLSNIILKNDIVVLDGYKFSERYQLKIKELAYKLVVIDDEANKQYYADLIINHGSKTAEAKYQRRHNSKVLTGFNYLILRKPFLQHSKLVRIVTKVDSVFICMGGADPFNITIKLVNACMLVSFIKHIDVVIGGAYSNKTELIKLLKKVKQSIDINIHENLNAEEVSNLITANEISICPASTISLEVASIQSGLLTGMVADNQQFIHHELLDRKCCISVGDFTKSSEKILAKKISYLGLKKNINRICANQFEAIDGKSGDRLLTEFNSLVSC